MEWCTAHSAPEHKDVCQAANAQKKEHAMRKSLLTLAAVTLAGLAAAPAAAAEEAEVTVPYADLNLATPAGTAALEARIDAAVREVCTKPYLRDLKAMTAWEECKAAAKVGAMEQLSVLEPFASIELASAF
jgi:UrcA family protein